MIIPVMLAVTRIFYCEAWTKSGLEQKINKKVEELELTVNPNYEEFIVKDIKFPTHYPDGAWVVYEIKLKE